MKLNSAITTIKEERMKCKKSDEDPVLEELKENEKEDNAENAEEIKNREKWNWMSSVKLGNSDFDQNHHRNTDELPTVDKTKKVVEM